MSFQGKTAVTAVSEIREKKRKDALKGSAPCHMLKLGNGFISLGKWKIGEREAKYGYSF